MLLYTKPVKGLPYNNYPREKPQPVLFHEIFSHIYSSSLPIYTTYHPLSTINYHHKSSNYPFSPKWKLERTLCLLPAHPPFQLPSIHCLGNENISQRQNRSLYPISFIFNRNTAEYIHILPFRVHGVGVGVKLLLSLPTRFACSSIHTHTHTHSLSIQLLLSRHRFYLIYLSICPTLLSHASNTSFTSTSLAPQKRNHGFAYLPRLSSMASRHTSSEPSGRVFKREGLLAGSTPPASCSTPPFRVFFFPVGRLGLCYLIRRTFFELI